PLFQVALASLNTSSPGGRLKFANLDATFESIEAGSLDIDLWFGLSEGRRDGIPHGANIAIRYGTDLFDRATVENLGAWLMRILEAAAEDASLRLSALPLLSAQERRQVLEEWNQTAVEVARGTI